MAEKVWSKTLTLHLNTFKADAYEKVIFMMTSIKSDYSEEIHFIHHAGLLG